MPSPARPALRFIACTGFGLLAAFTLVSNGPSRALQWPWFLYAQLLWLAPFIWLVTSALVGGQLARLGGTLDWALLAFAAANVASALASPFPATSVAQVPAVLAPVALAYAIATWLRQADGAESGRRLRLIAKAGAVFLVGVCVVSLVEWCLVDVIPRLRSPGASLLTFLPRNERPLGHGNFTGGLGLLTLAWLGALARTATGGRRLACWLGTLLGLGTLFSSGSRGAFLGLGAWIVWLLIGAARRRCGSARNVALTALGLATLATALAVAHPRTRVVLRQWHETGALNAGDRQRLAMAEFGQCVLRAHPALGIGPGTTPRVYPLFRSKLSGGVETALQLHSLPIQIAVDSGLCGLGAALAAAILLASRRRRAASSRETGYASGALVAYAVFALADYQLDVPLFAAYLGGGLGVAAGVLRQGRLLAFRPTRWWGLALVAGLTAFLGHAYRPWAARAAFADGIDSLRLGDTSGLERGTATAIARAPGETLYRNVHALLLADPAAYRDWFPAYDPGPQARERAIGELEASLRVDPAQEIAHYNLGWLLLSANAAAAEQHFLAAARLVPDKGNVYAGLGLARLALGKPAAAAFALELINDPTFMASPFWTVAPLPPGLAAEARTAAIGSLESIAAEISIRAPAASHRARSVAALLRWLNGDTAALDRAGALEPAQRPLLDWLSGHAPAAPPSAGWSVLAKAAAEPGRTPALMAEYYRKSGYKVPPETAAALAAAIGAADRRRLFLLPPEATAAIVWTRRERTAYGLLMRNLDAPPPRDLYSVPENPFVRDFLSALFPEKGYLPTPVLDAARARLPD